MKRQWLLAAAVMIGVIGLSGCGNKKNFSVVDLAKKSEPMVYFRNDNKLMYRKNYEDDDSEYWITEFYNNSIFLDSDVEIDPDNRYLYYKVPTGEVYGELYRVDTNSLVKEQKNPGELVEENVVRNTINFVGDGVLFQKYENEVWNLYYSCPGEELRQVFNGDVIKYYIDEDDIYILEQITTDRLAENDKYLWKYNIQTGECVEIDECGYYVEKGTDETEVLMYSKRENNGATLYGIKRNGEIVKYVENAKNAHRDRTSDDQINILFFKEGTDGKLDLYQYDGNEEILRERNVEAYRIHIGTLSYVKDGQVYAYIDKKFLHLSSNIDLENKGIVNVKCVLPNGDLVIEYTAHLLDVKDSFEYNYAIWKVEGDEIINEETLAQGCDSDSDVVEDVSSGEKIVYLYANMPERSNKHQLSVIDAEKGLRSIDADFSQGYADGTDIYSLKGEEFGNRIEIVYSTLYHRGRIENYENPSTLSVIHVNDDFVEEEVLADQVLQIIFAENGTMFCITNSGLFRIDQGETIKVLSNVSYMWINKRKVKKIGGKIIQTIMYS